MVSTMTMMALGFTGVCAALSLNFYRKYRLRLGTGGAVREYSRVADYHGVPLALSFEYQSEDGDSWTPFEVDVDEIYHYGADYFMRGYGLPDRKGNIFKLNRIARMRRRSDGRRLDSVEALLGEAATRLEQVEERGG